MHYCMAPRYMATVPLVHTLVIVQETLYGSLYLFVFCRALVLSHVLYKFVVCYFYFCFDYYFSISCCLRLIISSQSAMKGVFKIILHPNTSWPSVACNLVRFVLFTAKSVDARIPDQVPSSSKHFFVS